MRRVLGEPDVASDWQENDYLRRRIEIYGAERWARQYAYDSKWVSLSLHVHEREDGSIYYGYSGKWKGSDPSDRERPDR